MEILSITINWFMHVDILLGMLKLVRIRVSVKFTSNCSLFGWIQKQELLCEEGNHGYQSALPSWSERLLGGLKWAFRIPSPSSLLVHCNRLLALVWHTITQPIRAIQLHTIGCQFKHWYTVRQAGLQTCPCLNNATTDSVNLIYGPLSFSWV